MLFIEHSCEFLKGEFIGFELVIFFLIKMQVKVFLMFAVLTTPDDFQRCPSISFVSKYINFLTI